MSDKKNLNKRGRNGYIQINESRPLVPPVPTPPKKSNK